MVDNRTIPIKRSQVITEHTDDLLTDPVPHDVLVTLDT